MLMRVSKSETISRNCFETKKPVQAPKLRPGKLDYFGKYDLAY